MPEKTLVGQSVDGKSLVERCVAVLRRTWQTVGDEWLSMFPQGWCNRDAVLEVVLDADRYSTFGHDPEAIAEIRRRIKEHGWESKQLAEITDLAFPKSIKRWG